MPWLAASGPLSYTPEDPPPSDYWFQYGWILPDIFDPATNRRRHLYFGGNFKGDARELFAFWSFARQDELVRIACHFGGIADGGGVTAPMAIYSMRDTLDRVVYVFMQHGSYQVVPAEDQPLLEAGQVILYRGIERSTIFRFPPTGNSRTDPEGDRVWRSYVRTQLRILSDSVLSFNAVHDRAMRCETNHLRDGSRISDEIAKLEGLNPDSEGFGAELWNAAHQGFSLVRWVAENKFGPHFVAGRTPISNIRITTIFAGEHEVRIIDPDLVDFYEARGCRVVRPGSVTDRSTS